MDKKRLLMIAVGFSVVVVLGLGYLLGIQPQLSAAAAASAQASSITAANATSQAALDKLEKDYANLDQFSGKLTDLQRSVPSSPSMDTLLADLRALAASTGTTISAFDDGEAVAYVPPVDTAAVTPPADGGKSAPATSTPTPAPTAAAPVAPVAPRTTTNPLINASNFIAIPVKIGVKGTTEGAIAFLGGLQHGDRLVLVTGFSGTEDTGSGSGAGASAAPGAAPAGGATYSIDALVYVLASSTKPTASPDSAGSGSAPAPSASPTPSR